jgi:hypothetical protein
VTETCPVPPKRDRRGQGAQYERNFLFGKPRLVGGELQFPDSPSTQIVIEVKLGENSRNEVDKFLRILDHQISPRLF